MSHTFFDMFAGVGGFRLAFEREGFRCVGWCEIDRWCQKIYRYYYKPKGEFFKADILAIDPNELPDFDIITAGVPCQPFSYAGKRKGMRDKRGFPLWLAFFNIIKVKRPKIILIENVRGLLSSNGGRDFAWILFQMAKLGYSVEWCVLNSKDFGVPQNRERVFIIGYFGGECPAKVFPIEEADRVYYEAIGKSKKEKVVIYSPFNGSYSDVAYCLSSNSGSILNVAGQLIMVNGCFRKLTPLECFRLQGFPDDIVHMARKLGISDTQLYKMAGNAVTVPVAQSIARKLKKVLG